MKKLKGGAPRQRFFSQQWTLQLEPSELDAVQQQESRVQAESVVRSLQQENDMLKKKVLGLNNKLKEVASHEPKKQYKPIEELGARQKRRLKQFL